MEFSALVTQLGRCQDGGEIHSPILVHLPPDKNWKHILLCHPALLKVGVRFLLSIRLFDLLGLFFNFNSSCS